MSIIAWEYGGIFLGQMASSHAHKGALVSNHGSNLKSSDIVKLTINCSSVLLWPLVIST